MKIRSAFNLFAAFALCALFSSMAAAQATRTWVSGVGDDVNPCSRTAPCKTFAGAISKTAANGEISVLEPGGFGAVTITKSITINGEGPVSGITASLVNGIIINAGVNDVVTIRNIQILGAGNGLNGIRYLAAKQVNVENVTIYGFTNNGIDVSLGASAGALIVKNTNIIKCNLAGIRMASTGGALTGSVDNVRLQGCQFGLDILSGNVTVSRSVISHNTGIGLVAENNGTVLNAEGCLVSNNGTGVSAFTSGATVRISNCDIFNNGTGISIAAGGTVASAVNNKNAGNTTPGAPNAAITVH